MKTPDATAVPKKPYEKPTLERYGDIREIARNVGLMGMSDGGLLGILTRTQ